MIDKASAAHFGCWEWQTSGYMGIVGVLSWVFREGKKRIDQTAGKHPCPVRHRFCETVRCDYGAGKLWRRRQREEASHAVPNGGGHRVCAGGLSHRHGVARLRYTELMDMQPGWMGTVKRWGRVSQR